MTNFQDKIEQLLDTGYKILFELEKEELEIDKVKQLYNVRSEQIEELQKIPAQKFKNLSEREKMVSKNYFMRLNLLEKNINKALTGLSGNREEALKQINDHKKAKMSYSFSSLNKNGEQSKFIDLKSTG